MTSLQWRQDDLCVSRAQELMANPALQQMLEIVRREGPENFPVQLGTNETDKAMALGMVYGWRDALSMIAMLATKYTPASQPDPTFSE